MAQIRTWTVGLFLLAGVVGFFLPDRAHAATCDAIVGKWAWFIGGEVTVNPDGTFTQQSGNAGTWQCTDPARGRFTLRWRDGGFVNSLALSPDGRGLTSTDQSQWYVTAQRSAPAPKLPQLVRKENCCQENYGCETKRIEAEFTKKMATCHFPGNSGCISEATSRKASQLKAANEQLRMCNRAASGAVTGQAPATGGASLPASSDEFHSTEGTGGPAQGCQPCTATSEPSENATPWGKRVKVIGTSLLQNNVTDCFRRYRDAARQQGELAAVMRDVLKTLDADRPTSVTIRDAIPGDNETKPADLRKAQTQRPTDATIYLDWLNPDQYLPSREADDVCGVLIHEMEHAMRIMAGTLSRRNCQLPGGRLAEHEISAMALENVYRKLNRKPPLEYYAGIRLPDAAINPTRVDFENLSVPGWWCP